jgi:outer membrane cobalamin receptor
VLSITPIDASFANGRGEFSTSVYIMDHRFDFAASYDYFNYIPGRGYRETNITYRPENVFAVNLSYMGPLFEVNWENSFNGDVYVDPGSDEKLNSFVIGNLDLHIKLYRTFYIYSRINNIYNEEYFLRDGYPEPGVQYFAGLRIII